MNRKNKQKENLFTSICICIMILLISILGLTPLIKNLNFGLDLQEDLKFYIKLIA